MFRIEYYKDSNGKIPLISWLKSLSISFQSRIEKRIDRLEYKHYGDYRKLKQGLIEIKLHFGAGYRIYCIEQKRKIILLCGGDKSTQQRDIEKAKEYIKELEF